MTNEDVKTLTKVVTKPKRQRSKPQPPATVQDALLAVVTRADIDPDRLEKFLDLQIKMEDRQANMEFQQSLSGFQGDCPIIVKTKKVDFKSKNGNSTKYDYAPLDEIVFIIKPILQKHGLAFSFNIVKTEDKEMNELVTRIYHKSGGGEVFSYFYRNLGDDSRMNMSQRAKSALTFAKRAALENALGVATAGEDDDARRAIDTVASDAEIDEIKSIMEKTGTKEEQFLKFLKVDSLEGLSVLEANKAIHALKQKRVKGIK